MEDAEVIIINDGSTDATLNIINNVVATVATKMEVKIISQENKGLSETRNIGIRTARGRYWTTVDADDEVVDGGLQALLAAAERDEYPDVIYGNTDVYNIIGGGYSMSNIECYRNDDATLSGDYTAANVVERFGKNAPDKFGCTYVTAWGKIFKRDFTVDNNLWFTRDMFKNEDLEFTWRMLPNMTSATFVDVTVYKYLAYNSYMTAKFRGKAEIDSYVASRIVMFKNIAKLTDNGNLRSIETKLRERTAIDLYGLSIKIYDSKYQGKSKMLKQLRNVAKEIDIDMCMYLPSGFSNKLAKLFKHSTWLTHITLTLVCQTPFLRRRLSVPIE
jgi:glycosyltransferase involved in cell wall biosynthesis